MDSIPATEVAAWAQIADEEIVDRIRTGEVALYEVLMRRYNQRLYRVAMSILRNDAEAEDVMQDAYVRAYVNLHQFAGEAKFATWLTKIAVYEALARLRRRGRTDDLESVLEKDIQLTQNMTQMPRDPETRVYDEELRIVMQRAIHALPSAYRSVFVLRAAEGLSVAETAACLGLSAEAVKTRFHRGRSLLRKQLHREAGISTAQLFPFHLSRCNRIVETVLRRCMPPDQTGRSI